MYFDIKQWYYLQKVKKWSFEKKEIFLIQERGMTPDSAENLLTGYPNNTVIKIASMLNKGRLSKKWT